MAKRPSTRRAEHDSAWKRALLKYLPDFFELFFPKLFQQVDWSRRPKFLDKELQAIAPSAGKGGGRRTVDVLVELCWRDGGPMLVLVHIEVQAQKETEFPKRVFFYHARITEIYAKPLCTLVVLADKHPSWRPDRYSVAFAGSSLQFEFPTIKLLDFKERLPVLERSTNPFAHLVAATLHAQAAKDRDERKYNLVTGLYDLGLSRKEIVEFYGFIDQVLRLSRQQEKKFKMKLTKFEKEKKMRYVTSIERLALEEGLEKGLEKGLETERLQALKIFLEARFETLPAELSRRLESLSAEQLQPLLPLAATVASLEEFTTRIPAG